MFDVFFLSTQLAVHKSSATKPSIEDIYIIWMIVDDALDSHKHQDLTCVCMVVFLYHHCSISVCMYVYFQTHPNSAACAIRWCSAANIHISSQCPNFAWNCRQRSANIGIKESMASGVSCAWWIKWSSWTHRLMSLKGIRLLSGQFQSDRIHQKPYVICLFFLLNPHRNSNSLHTKLQVLISPPHKGPTKTLRLQGMPTKPEMH